MRFVDQPPDGCKARCAPFNKRQSVAKQDPIQSSIAERLLNRVPSVHEPLGSSSTGSTPLIHRQTIAKQGAMCSSTARTVFKQDAIHSTTVRRPGNRTRTVFQAADGSKIR